MKLTRKYFESQAEKLRQDCLRARQEREYVAWLLSDAEIEKELMWLLTGPSRFRRDPMKGWGYTKGVIT